MGNYCPKKSVLFSRSHFFFLTLSFLPTLPYPIQHILSFYAIVFTPFLLQWQYCWRFERFLYDCPYSFSFSVAKLLALFTLFYLNAFSPSFLPFYSRIPSPPLINIYSFLVFFISPLNFLPFPSKAPCDLFFYCLLLQTCSLFDWKLGNYCPKRCSVKTNI